MTMRWLYESATRMMDPLTATPPGLVNWLGPFPCEPTCETYARSDALCFMMRLL